MLQHISLKEVVRIFDQLKPSRLFGALFFCAFLFCLFSPLFGQEGVVQRVTAPIAAPIQSVIAQSFPQPPRVPASPQVNSALPGLGTFPSGHFGNSALLPPVSAGSLEFLSQEAPSVASANSGTGIIQTQFISSPTIPQLPEGSNLNFRRVQFTSRSDNNFSVRLEPYDPNDYARGGIVVLTGGINLII